MSQTEQNSNCSRGNSQYPPTPPHLLISLNINHHTLNDGVVLVQMKLAILEQKLLKEEHERKLVQEKADEVGHSYSRTCSYLFY